MASEHLVSIAHLALKRVDNAKEAEPIVKLIKETKKMTALSLVGTSVGVDAARAIGEALSIHTELQEALWADMFVSRLKDEIPEALIALGNGLKSGSCQLSLLDLSDNAIGPVGFRGLAPWLVSPVCYYLQELKLNNTGMGPHGSCLLADALDELVDATKSLGGFKLRSFVCGRSRVENQGAKKLASVFAKMGHLEKIVMPQDGIGHEGISAICNALKCNPKMKHIDFSDNTLTKPGSEAIAQLLPELPELEVLILGDCLLTDEGAFAIASALEHSHLPNLKHLSIQYNELCLDSISAVVESLEQKTALECFEISGNPIGREGAEQIEGMLDALDKAHVLGELEEIDDEYDEENEEEEEDDDENENAGEDNENINNGASSVGKDLSTKQREDVSGPFVVRGVGIKQTATSESAPKTNPLLSLFENVARATESKKTSPSPANVVANFSKLPPGQLNKQWIHDVANRYPCTLELSMHLLVQLASECDSNKGTGVAIDDVNKFADELLQELKQYYSNNSKFASFDNGLASAFLSAFGLVKGEALQNTRRSLPTRGEVWSLVGHLNAQAYFNVSSRIVRSFLNATASSGWGEPFAAGSHQDLVRRNLLGTLSPSST